MNIDYSVLPKMLEVLTDKDLEEYKDFDIETKYRWITSVKRIDWKKLFSKNKCEDYTLPRLAASSVPNNIIGFLRPDWINRPLQKYLTVCPGWAKRYANSFENSVDSRNFDEMREWFEITRELTEC